MAEGGNKEESERAGVARAKGGRARRAGVDEPHSPLRENTGSSCYGVVGDSVSQWQKFLPRIFVHTHFVN